MNVANGSSVYGNSAVDIGGSNTRGERNFLRDYGLRMSKVGVQIYSTHEFFRAPLFQDKMLKFNHNIMKGYAANLGKDSQDFRHQNSVYGAAAIEMGLI